MSRLLAKDLEQNSPEAFSQFELHFEYKKDEKLSLLNQIDDIFSYWSSVKTQEAKRAIWRQMV